MFIIASSGRCGSYALTHGLNQFSDHQVFHEPAPQLLTEAFLKHLGQPYETEIFKARMNYFTDRAKEKYGESFRAPNLLTQVHQAAPQTKFLIIVRNPLEYVVSGYSKKLFQKDDIFDQTRLIPQKNTWDFSLLSVAEKIAWHWVTVNTYLLDFFESKPTISKLMVLSNLDDKIDQIADFLNVTITNREGMSVFLRSNPNKKLNSNLPSGFCIKTLTEITGEIWKKALKYHDEIEPVL